ncbi:MAG: SRPBCC family protein [Acidimicrobiia bacterium]
MPALPWSRITVSTVIDASPDEVWDAVEDIGSHTGWMADAEEIRITSAQTSGVGTTFECDTKVGPFRLTDLMEITRWEPGRAMGVRHVGIVTGEGTFTLAPAGRRLRRRRATRFTWSEQLTFPWWMGGPLGAAVGGRVLKLIWRRNLRALKEIVEGGR